jgi:hypothetical protein
VRGEAPHADWEVLPTTPWNYALRVDPKDPGRSFSFAASALGENPFETPPVLLLAEGCLLPGWTLEKSAAAPPPQSPVTSAENAETLTLIPYGAAKLRITEFPVLKE